MKIALLGYGKMGQLIAQLAEEAGHEITLKANSSNPLESQIEALKNSDVAIEFSLPQLALDHLKTCLENKIPVVCGTTGWLEHYASISQQFQNANLGFLYASNFSIGVNIFFALNEKLAQMMSKQEQYQAKLTEIHHIHKLDAPSGTAITLAEGFLQQQTKYKQWSLDEGQAIASDQLPIEAIRENEVPGTHLMTYQSVIDSIEIKHTAHNRHGFASGALLAAEYVAKHPGVHHMKDVLDL